MNGNNGNSDRIEMILSVCDYYYNQNLPQKDIAKLLKCSAATISRVLDEARSSKFVRVSLHPPLNNLLSSQLADSLERYGIHRVIVTEERSVGWAAGRFFEAHYKSGMTVVLDGGHTIKSFVQSLVGSSSGEITIIPICADPPSYEISAYELMTRMSVKYGTANCLKMPHHRGHYLDTIHRSVSEKARHADFVFLGTGPWQSGYTALEFVRHLGLDPDQLAVRHNHLFHMCGYCGLDRQGNEIHLDELDSRMPRSLTFNDLKKLAVTPERHVVLLTESTTKRDSVVAVLRARLCNTLIVDHKLARVLLEYERSEG